MKVKIKDLEPNPFREWENFQLHRKTVEMLKDSIQETFFWENMIGRQVNGKIQIAYGHHRLQALRELYPNGNKAFDIPIYPLNDEQMFIIMARENETGKNLTIPNIDLTVKKAKEFLEANSEIAKKYGVIQRKKNISFFVGDKIISRFLGWDEHRVQHSLERLQSDIVDKKAVESMPSEGAAGDFVQAVKWTGASKETQQKVAKKIVVSRTKKDTEEGAITGKYRMETEMFEEEHGEDQKKRKEMAKRKKDEERRQFEHYLTQVKEKAESLKRSLVSLLGYKDVLLSSHYQKSKEGQDFVYAMADLFDTFRILMIKKGKESDLVESFKLLIESKKKEVK